MIRFLSQSILSRHRSELEKGVRLLWLTDTFDDHNGVSIVLQSIHQEIKRQHLPIDILVSSKMLDPDDHLLVVRPVSEFNFPFYRQQPIRIPNLLEIRRIFMEGHYDRIICSTEGPMGMAALYLKKAFSVKTYFYLHTDWLMFAQTSLKMEQTGLNRVRRLLRFYYTRYDGLFVLNTEQQAWLSGKEMNIDPSRVFLTAHWVDSMFQPMGDTREALFGVSPTTPVVLFAGRLSQEKGIIELPELYKRAKERIPGLTMVIAGTGPEEKHLLNAMPGAIFLGWVDHDKLPEVYSSADIMVLPSRFDTFSCVVLEALSCGLPVVAYKSKGPRDILQHQGSGYLVSDADEMLQTLITFFSENNLREAMKTAALSRSKAYKSEKILTKFLTDVGLQRAG